MPSYCPSFNFCSLVGTLPLSMRISTNGFIAFICNPLRRLLVPITLPAGRSLAEIPVRVISTSRQSSRASTAPIHRPSASCIGTSLALCTAISIVLSKSCCSISCVKTPFPPNEASGWCKIISPFVIIGTISIFSFGKCSCIFCFTSSVWIIASLLVRVPILIMFPPAVSVYYRIQFLRCQRTFLYTPCFKNFSKTAFALRFGFKPALYALPHRAKLCI